MIATFEFDESVNEKDIAALQNRERARFSVTNFYVGDHVRLYPEGSNEGITFKCVARRHEIMPDEKHGDSQIVFVLGST